MDVKLEGGTYFLITGIFGKNQLFKKYIYSRQVIYIRMELLVCGY